MIILEKDVIDDDSFKKNINVVIKSEEDKNKVLDNLKLTDFYDK